MTRAWKALIEKTKHLDYNLKIFKPPISWSQTAYFNVNQVTLYLTTSQLRPFIAGPKDGINTGHN